MVNNLAVPPIFYCDCSFTTGAGFLITPVGGVGFTLNTIATGAGVGSAYMRGELVSEAGEIGMSELHRKALEDMLGGRTGARVNTLLDLSGYHESNTDFIPTDAAVIENINNYLRGDDNEDD